MRGLAVIIGVLLVVSHAATAQTDKIGAYHDIAGTDCNIVDGSGFFVTVYIVHSTGFGTTASSFSAPKPDCFSATWLSDTEVFPTIGDSQTGVAINYGSCQGGSFHILTINYYAPSVTPDCCPYTVLSYDGTLPPIVDVVDCGLNTMAGVGETSQINKTAACDCCLPGTIYVPPYPSIEAAIDAACSGDTIILADGIYTGYGNRDIFITNKSITLKSASGDPDLCVIAPSESELDEYFGFHINSEFGDTVVFEGIGIEKSHDLIYPPISGGGNSSNRMSLVLRNCRIRQNNRGVDLYYADMVVENCIFEDNDEWGLRLGTDAVATIDECEFRYNGGIGLYVQYATKVVVNESISTDNNGAGIVGGLTDSLIVRNTEITDNYGDGVGVADNDVVIDSCTISGNDLWGVAGSVGIEIEIHNTVLANNTLGAVLYGAGATGLLNGCTLYGNSGTIVQCSSSPSEIVEINNTIIASNPATFTVNLCDDVSVTCTDIWGNVGGDWVGDFASFEGINGNVSIDPLFCDPDNGDFTLASLSVCLPAANLCGVLIGAHGEGCDEPTAVDTRTQPHVEGLSLCQNRPNPFNPSTTISFTLPERAVVKLSIYGIDGTLVTNLVEGVLDEGRRDVTWDGKDAHGTPVSTGVYFYRLEAGNRTLTKKMVLLK